MKIWESKPPGTLWATLGLLRHCLSPRDFHLIPKMKEPLRGIRFRTVPEILQAVDRSIRTINTTGAAKGILRLPHRWQGLYTMLVTTLKDSKTSKHVSILYQL